MPRQPLNGNGTHFEHDDGMEQFLSYSTKKASIRTHHEESVDLKGFPHRLKRKLGATMSAWVHRSDYACENMLDKVERSETEKRHHLPSRVPAWLLLERSSLREQAQSELCVHREPTERVIIVIVAEKRERKTREGREKEKREERKRRERERRKRERRRKDERERKREREKERKREREEKKKRKREK